MNQANEKDFTKYDDDGKQVLPSGLNVLTILTFIGCSLLMLFSLGTPWLLNFGKNAIEKRLSSGAEIAPKEMEDLLKSKDNILKAEANMYPMMIIGIVGILLCFVGALWMRKYKKDGFWIYVAGQVVPIAGGLILMGTGQYQDWKSYAGLAIPVLFIILYATQRKYLVR